MAVKISGQEGILLIGHREVCKIDKWKITSESNDADPDGVVLPEESSGNNRLLEAKIRDINWHRAQMGGPYDVNLVRSNGNVMIRDVEILYVDDKNITLAVSAKMERVK